MARMYPATPLEQTESSAERLLFAELARQLPPDYTVLHGVRWLSRSAGRSRDGEADFVIAHPKLGLLILEVKGGAISRDSSGQWFSWDRHGVCHAIKDPFDQAQRSLYALRDKLRDAPGTRPFDFPIARAVAFPDILIDGAYLGPAAPRDMVLDSSDLGHLEQSIARTWDVSAGSGPGPAGVNAVIDLLQPTVALRRPGLAAAIRQEHTELLLLTAQQLTVLDFLGSHRRVAISGVAGSGKTMLALEETRRLAVQGFRVLFTCYNKALADWATESLRADLGAAMERVVVDNYHDLAVQMTKRAGIAVPSETAVLASGKAQAFYEEELPQHLLDALSILPERFDAIVVDEGQDFADIWWVTLEAMLASAEDGVLFVFYDDNQCIFGSRGGYPIPLPHFQLTHNCRNTRRIHQAAMAYRDNRDPVQCHGPEGRTLELIPIPDGGELAALRRVLHRLVVEEGIALSDIVVLTPRGPKTSRLTEGAQLGNLSLTWGEGDTRTVRCRSIQAYKGLESPVVILAEPERAHASNRDALFHVALSRARHHLIVLGELPATVGADTLANEATGAASTNV